MGPARAGSQVELRLANRTQFCYNGGTINHALAWKGGVMLCR